MSLLLKRVNECRPFILHAGTWRGRRSTRWSCSSHPASSATRPGPTLARKPLMARSRSSARASTSSPPRRAPVEWASWGKCLHECFPTFWRSFQWRFKLCQVRAVSTHTDRLNGVTTAQLIVVCLERSSATRSRFWRNSGYGFDSAGLMRFYLLNACRGASVVSPSRTP